MTWSTVFLDSSRRLRTPWRFAIFGVGLVILQVVLNVALAIGIVVYLMLSGGMNGPQQLPMDAEKLQKQWGVPLLIIAAVPGTLLNFGLVFLCRWLLDRRSIWSLGLMRPARRVTASVEGGFLAGVVPIVVAVCVVVGVGGYRFTGVSASLQTVLLVPTFVVMAFNEEIICRGYLLQNLIDIGRPRWGVVFSSTVFWLMHLLNPAAWSSPLVAVNLLGAGFVLALAYRVSGNIWFPTALHFGWNLGQGILFEVPVSGIRTDGLVDLVLNGAFPSWLTGGEFGLEASVLVTALEAALALVFARILSQEAEPNAIVLSAADDPGHGVVLLEKADPYVNEAK